LVAVAVAETEPPLTIMLVVAVAEEPLFLVGYLLQPTVLLAQAELALLALPPLLMVEPLHTGGYTLREEAQGVGTLHQVQQQLAVLAQGAAGHRQPFKVVLERQVQRWGTKSAGVADPVFLVQPLSLYKLEVLEVLEGAAAQDIARLRLRIVQQVTAVTD
jgi:hypothetical protein